MQVVSQPTAAPAATSHSASPAAQKLFKLHKAAAEFESILLTNLWKSMKGSFTVSDDDESTDPAHGALDDMGIQAMSSAVGKAGGLGLGKLILKHLEPMMGHTQALEGKGSTLPADSFGDAQPK
jgi:Rod binding domain-containing protein